MNDLISVLLPVYNAEQFLEKCLISIREQSYQSFEVIVVDDGSTDTSPKILANMAASDHRFKLYRFPENRGIVAALNFGLEQCSSRWIARIDADDRMHPQRLDLQLQHMLTHSNVDVLGCRIKLFRHNGELTPGQLRYQDWSNSLLSDREIKANIFAESPIMHPTFFISKRFYQSLKGYQDNPWPEDYDFLFRAYQLDATFAKLPRNLVEKGDHPLRLARTDERCKRKAMFHAKAHYFKKRQDLWKNRELYLVGSGSSGKMVMTALKHENICVDGIIDNSGAGNEQKIFGLPSHSLNLGNAAGFFSRISNPLFLSCIGVEQSRVEVEKLFLGFGYKPGIDFLRFI
ncbi:glycosyltransferase [bacterium]|nr:glycosyltransferase [bacterium]